MIEDQLQGLILAPQEKGFNSALWLGLFLLATLLGLVLWRWTKTHNSALFKAQKSLDHLIKNASSTSALSAADKQTTAIKCAQILSAGFGVKHLDQYQPANADQWQAFTQQLNTLCYSNDSNIELDPLLQEAKSFLLDETQYIAVADK